MIDYKKDRLDYGEQLHPPIGYLMDMAITTTYSLDLFALLSIPVALFYSKNLDGDVKETRMDILDAIQKTSERLKVYCQKGKIKVPSTHNKIVSFIEDSITEILPNDAYSSFHPKIWVIRYTQSKKPTVYRILIMSRNLTFNRSWDLAYSMEGIVGRKVEKKNKPLVDYVKYLSKISNFKESNKFISELNRAKFDIDFDDFSFCPMGIKNYKNPLPEKFNDALIISPFINKNGLELIDKRSTGKKYLFSRREELNKISPDILTEFETYSFSQNIVDGEDYFDDGSNEDSLPQNLHAKLYILENKSYTDWFVGSANCTSAALDRNHEFLINLKTTSHDANINAIFKELTSDEKGQYFEKYEQQEAIEFKEEDIEQRLRRLTYDLLKYLDQGGIKAKCDPIDGDEKKFIVSIFSKPNDVLSNSDFVIKFTLYGRDEYQKLDPIKGNKFKNINLYNLSPFIHWTIEHPKSSTMNEFITKIDIDLPKDRKDSIFRSLIENKEKFFQLLQFLLGNNVNQLEFLSNSNGKGKEVKGKHLPIWDQDTPLFEEFLMAASRDPEKLREIDKIIERLDSFPEESPVPDEFKDFWEIFKP